MTETQTNAITKAFCVIETAIKQDHGYAWTWHCNIAMGFYDVGGEHKLANEGAARFMMVAFGVDMTACQEYRDLMKAYD